MKRHDGVQSVLVRSFPCHILRFYDPLSLVPFCTLFPKHPENLLHENVMFILMTCRDCWRKTASTRTVLFPAFCQGGLSYPCRCRRQAGVEPSPTYLIVLAGYWISPACVIHYLPSGRTHTRVSRLQTDRLRQERYFLGISKPAQEARLLFLCYVNNRLPALVISIVGSPGSPARRLSSLFPQSLTRWPSALWLTILCSLIPPLEAEALGFTSKGGRHFSMG